MDDYRLIVSLIDGTTDLVYSVLPDRSFEFVNHSWLAQLGYDERDLEVLRLKDVVYPGFMKRHDELIADVLKGKSMSEVELTLLTKEREMIEVKGNMFPRMEEKKVVAATGFFRDVTEEKRLQKELEEAQSRIEFIVDLMIHDLTNINQEILSLFEIFLYDSELTGHYETLIQEGLQEVEKASTLITHVRKVVGLNEEVPEQMEWDLRKIIDNVMQDVKKEFPEKALQLTTDVKEDQYILEADKYLPDVFFSLLHNSAKFDNSETVHIELEATILKHTPFLRIEIKDYGPGIPDEVKDTIFSEVLRKQSVLGTGIGLSLVKALVKNYGGYISVEDRITGDYTRGVNFILLLRRVMCNDAMLEG